MRRELLASKKKETGLSLDLSLIHIFRTSLKEKPVDGDGGTLPDFTEGQIFDSAETVSYTHLDVYKRQPRRCGMVLPQGSARPPACNLPRKNVPIPYLESTSTVPTVRRTGWTRQKPLSPQRKFSVPSVLLTRQPEKAKRSFTLKKWRNAPMDACGTIRFLGRSMRCV